MTGALVLNCGTDERALDEIRDPIAGIEPSAGSVGGSDENALAKTIDGSFEAEVIRGCGPWRSVAVVEDATLEWVDWHDDRRPLAPTGSLPPVEAEAREHAHLGDQALAA